MSENKVTYGFEQVHLAFRDKTATTQPEWETPISIPGAVRFTPTTVGESSTFYADNHAYYVTTSNNGYTAELEMALVPDAIKARMLGWEIDSNGMLVEVVDGQPEKFALLGEVKGDKRNRRLVYFDCQASRPAKEHATKGESVEVKTDVLPLAISPIMINGRTIVKGNLELSATNATAFNGFFDEVLLPSFAPAGGGG